MSNNQDVFNQLANTISNGEPSVLATVVASQNSTSAKAGDKTLIDSAGISRGWVGGGCVQSVVKKVASQVLAQNKSALIRVCPPAQFVEQITCYPSHCASEGSLDIFLEPINNAPNLLLYGSSPVAIACAALAKHLDFSVHWHTDENTFAQHNSAQISRIDNLDHLPSAAVAIVATQGLGDSEALHSAMHSTAGKVLLVASAKKAASIMAQLQQQQSEREFIDKIVSPAGLEIAADGVKEIAFSVMAQVLILKNFAAKAALSATPDIPTNTASTASPTMAIVPASRPSCCGGK